MKNNFKKLIQIKNVNSKFKYFKDEIDGSLENTI